MNYYSALVAHKNTITEHTNRRHVQQHQYAVKKEGLWSKIRNKASETIS